MLIKDKRRDGHVHSPYCPHGTKDGFEEYVEEAIGKGILEMTFTEHFPLPAIFTDEEFLKECSMQENQVLDYIKEVIEVKNKYKDKIKINLGFEVDYIEGYEKKIKEDLQKYGKYIEDALLSVHFVRYEGDYYAIDYIEDFKKLIEKTSDISKVYDLYYETLLKSIEADLGCYKPKRISHPTLVRIFNSEFPCNYKNYELLEKVGGALKEGGYMIDVNTAGLRKPYCNEVYPSGKFNEIIEKYSISGIYGSDSHTAKDVGYRFD